MFATEVSDAFTVVLKFLMLLTDHTIKSSLMPLLFIPEFSDAFTLGFCGAFTVRIRVLMPLLFVLEFSKASDNLASFQFT